MPPRNLQERKSLVLVTGGTGLVGSALQEVVSLDRQVRDKYQFIFLGSKDADLCQISQAHQVFKTYKPDYVINLAAKVGGLYANMSDNNGFYSANNAINEHVLSLADKFNVKKCISCLSTCIFPDKITYPIDETKVTLRFCRVVK